MSKLNFKKILMEIKYKNLFPKTEISTKQLSKYTIYMDGRAFIKDGK